MKKFVITSISILALSATSASASEIFSDISTANGLPKVSSEAAENLETCMSSTDGSSKSIRACSKALKTVVPNYAIKSNIYTQRGLLKLSAGRYDAASKDFKSAAKLNKENEFAYLGEGFASIMQEDYSTALDYFSDCQNHKKTAPLAVYGRAIAKELTGDTRGAYADFRQAADMRPDWAAPRDELKRFKIPS
ncbi:MAG: hypothetical protein EX271_06375 [Acidimicrobiales bacterium]|nr:hypothetical protein [Hyphomonadaceae bacterium]RZV42221.1 MAG: hypothetical protein EX271_06375 [Acidimicrobiales bacterium]